MVLKLICKVLAVLKFSAYLSTLLTLKTTEPVPEAHTDAIYV